MLWWGALWAFIGGFLLNAAYGTLQLALLSGTGYNLDTRVIGPIFGGAKTQGMSLLGRVTNVDQFGGTTSTAVYRLTGFSEDPNHFGVLVNMPLMLLLALVLRARTGWVAERRGWLAAAATALFLAQLLSQSRSGLLGCGVGLLVLAIALRRYLFRRELVIPVVVLALAASVVVVAKRDQLQQVLDSRFQTGDRSSRIHTDLYDLIPPVLESHPALGLGLNNFAVYYEFQTGKTDFGPHSFYIAVLTETGLVGGALYLAFLAWTVSRLLVLLRAGRARGRAAGRRRHDRRGRLGLRGRTGGDPRGEPLLPDDDLQRALLLPAADADGARRAGAGAGAPAGAPPAARSGRPTRRPPPCPSPAIDDPPPGRSPPRSWARARRPRTPTSRWSRSAPSRSRRP